MHVCTCLFLLRFYYWVTDSAPVGKNDLSFYLFSVHVLVAKTTHISYDDVQNAEVIWQQQLLHLRPNEREKAKSRLNRNVSKFGWSDESEKTLSERKIGKNSNQNYIEYRLESSGTTNYTKRNVIRKAKHMCPKSHFGKLERMENRWSKR